MSYSGSDIVFLFEKLIATNIYYEVGFIDGTQDVVAFKDVYLYANGLNVKYFSQIHNDLKTSLVEDLKTINNKTTENWVEKIKKTKQPLVDLNFKNPSLALTEQVNVPVGGPTSKVLLSISKLTRSIKEWLEQDKFQNIWVCGEVSNYIQSSSGHAYFNLKDENASISSVIFRGVMPRVKFKIENGLKVEVLASVSVYAKRGNYQLIVQKISPEGIGELQLAFEQLKKRLALEGLFDPSHKKPIPKYPETIGVITSRYGAALHDITKTTQIEFPNVRLIIYPSLVQGEKAANQLAEMIELANKHQQCDILIVGRGGGSIEDLWAFNEERLVRSIFFSSIPIVSAVGHEVDFTIADFVADYRAATPTAAAEYISRHKKNLLKNITMMENKIAFNLNQKMQWAKSLLEASKAKKLARIIYSYYRDTTQRIDGLDKEIKSSFKQRHWEACDHIHNATTKLDALSPLKVLKRGYSVVCDDKNQIINDGSKLNEKDEIEIRFYKGGVRAKVIKDEVDYV